MTKEQAQQLILDMYNKFQGTIQDHNVIQQALLVLGIMKQPPKKEEKESCEKPE